MYEYWQQKITYSVTVALHGKVSLH